MKENRWSDLIRTRIRHPAPAASWAADPLMKRFQYTDTPKSLRMSHAVMQHHKQIYWFNYLQQDKYVGLYACRMCVSSLNLQWKHVYHRSHHLSHMFHTLRVPSCSTVSPPRRKLSPSWTSLASPSAPPGVRTVLAWRHSKLLHANQRACSPMSECLPIETTGPFCWSICNLQIGPVMCYIWLCFCASQFVNIANLGYPWVMSY